MATDNRTQQIGRLFDVVARPIMTATMHAIWPVTGRGIMPVVLMGYREWGAYHREMVDLCDGDPDTPPLRHFFGLKLVLIPYVSFWGILEPDGALRWVNTADLDPAAAVAEAERILGFRK